MTGGEWPDAREHRGNVSSGFPRIGMQDLRSNSPPSRRKREKDGAAPPIFVAKGWASPLPDAEDR